MDKLLSLSVSIGMLQLRVQGIIVHQGPAYSTEHQQLQPWNAQCRTCIVTLRQSLSHSHQRQPNMRFEMQHVVLEHTFTLAHAVSCSSLCLSTAAGRWPWDHVHPPKYCYELICPGVFM